MKNIFFLCLLVGVGNLYAYNSINRPIKTTDEIRASHSIDTLLSKPHARNLKKIADIITSLYSIQAFMGESIRMQRDRIEQDNEIIGKLYKKLTHEQFFDLEAFVLKREFKGRRPAGKRPKKIVRKKKQSVRAEYNYLEICRNSIGDFNTYIASREEEDGVYVCQYCCKEFNALELLQRHQDAKSLCKRKRFCCPESTCNHSYGDHNNRKTHIENKHFGIAYQCRLCEKECASEYGMRAHIRSKHNKYKEPESFYEKIQK